MTPRTDDDDSGLPPSKLVVAVAIVLVCVVGATWLIRAVYEAEDAARYADTLGGVGSVVAAGLVALTLYMQSHELRLQRKQLRLQRDELRQTRDELERHRGEFSRQGDLLEMQNAKD